MSRRTTTIVCLLAALVAVIWTILDIEPDSSVDTPAPAPLARPHIARDFPLVWDYDDIRGLIKDWHDQAPQWCDVGAYGKSSRGQPLCYVRVHRPDSQGTPVWVQCCIHGNEPLSTAVGLSWCARVLNDCPEVLDQLDLYLIPVVCPDSFPSSRQCDGVDPNRNYDGQSIPPISAIKELFTRVHPRAAASLHTSGRLFMIPPGNTRTNTPEEAQYQDLFGRMARLAQYRLIHGYEMYGQPIMGSEMDYYHAGGSASCIVELGTHQHLPSLEDTRTELERTWPAFRLWLQEAPMMRRYLPLGSRSPGCPLTLELR